MARRLRRALRQAGVRDRGEDRVMTAFDRAMEVRHGLLPSEDDPRYLHPGRVVLILLGDVEEDDPGVLGAGALAESRDMELRVESAPGLPFPDWGRGLGGELTDSELLEELVTLPTEMQGVAMAEALDQLRHAHLWSDPVQRGRAAALAEAVFLPLAPRIHPVLERRLGWWVRRVGARLRG
jgi:hypothetical protein